MESALTQLDKSKTPGSYKICPSILKRTRRSCSTYRFFSRNVSIVALYPRHGYIVRSPQSSRDQEADTMTITIGEPLYNHVLKTHSTNYLII